MRLRNIPRAESVLEACKEVVKNPESLCGHWNQEFQNERPLHIEIGMGKGQFILTLAEQNPDINYIGIERYSSVLLRAVEKFQELEAAQVAKVKDEVAFVVLNGNYALEAGYSVSKDSIAYEKADSEAAKTYVNIIGVKEGNENSDGIKALVKVLKSDDIKKFINDKYDGAVIPFED